MRKIAPLFVSAVLLAAVSASADELNVTFSNESGLDVQFEFRSLSYYNRVWPGGNQAYTLGYDETRTVSLACQFGEKIAYGAWVNGDADIYWGVGIDGSEACESCVYTCGQSYDGVNLTNTREYGIGD